MIRSQVAQAIEQLRTGQQMEKSADIDAIGMDENALSQGAHGLGFKGAGSGGG